MSCTSGSVQGVADKTAVAKEQIEKLQKMIEDQSVANKDKFYAEITKHFSDARITDGREISYNSAIKTEYTSEFSLDKIAAVVTAALKALAAVKNPSIGAPATSPEAIAAYADVVNSVAEAAKSSSTASANLSFSMNRLSPGLFAFLYAWSVNIKDEDTFGTEAVTSTAIYYRFMQSIDDLNNEVIFNEALIDADNLIHMKMLQAALTDDLASSKIDIDGWMKKDDSYSKAIERIQSRLDTHTQLHPETNRFTLAKAPSPESAAVQEVVREAIHKLSAMGDIYKDVVKKSNARLASFYY